MVIVLRYCPKRRSEMVGTRSRAIRGGRACGVVGMRSRASGVAHP